MYNAGSDTAPPVPTSPGYPPQPLADYPQQPLADYPPQPLADYPPQHPPDYPPQPIPPSYAPPQQAGYPPPQQTSQQTSNTTVIIQQPQAEVVLKGPEQWSSGLFDIFDDCGLCFLGICCPSCLAGQVASKAGEWYCVGTSCPVALRSSIRSRYNIEGSVLRDACTMACCPLCAYCQMGRELSTRMGR